MLWGILSRAQAIDPCALSQEVSSASNVSRRDPVLDGNETPSSNSTGCITPQSKCLINPTDDGKSDYFSPCGTPCSPLSPSDTITYYVADRDEVETISVTYSDTSGFTFKSTPSWNASWGPFPKDPEDIPKWNKMTLEFILPGYDRAYIYYRQVPDVFSGGRKGEWFMDGWTEGVVYPDAYVPTTSCICTEPNELYPANASSASGTIPNCGCMCYKYYRKDDDIYDSFYMTFDGTYFSIFDMFSVHSFDTDQTNTVIDQNKFTIKINKNDGTASYEITPTS